MNAVSTLQLPQLRDDPFRTFGIEHLSPSTCGKFEASPAAFILDKLLKKSFPVGAAAHRGTAVEDGVAFGLFNPGASLPECVAIAQKKFDQLTAMCADSRVEKERAGLEGMVTQALAELRPYGVPDTVPADEFTKPGERAQRKVSVSVPGLAVPIIGYIDFGWTRHSTLVDLKTTWQCPGEIKLAHARQVSLYKKDTGFKSARVSYNTNKKSATYEAENCDQHFDTLVKIGMTMQRFLSLSTDPLELASLVVPDVEHFYFNDPLARQSAFEVWGI